MLEHLRLLSRYNQWMNDKLYSTAAKLPDDELTKDRGAFFGSLLSTKDLSFLSLVFCESIL